MALKSVTKKKANVKVDELPEQVTIEIKNNKGVKVVYIITDAQDGKGGVNLSSDIGTEPLEGNLAGFFATAMFQIINPPPKKD